MSFEVVLAHCWHSKNVKGLFFFLFKNSRGLAVPVFMFTAFILTGKYIISRNKQKISARLNRLFIMQFSWAVIYTVFFALSAVLLNKGMFAGKSFAHVLMMFAGQIIFGHTVNATMWFQADLIFITAMFAFIFFKFTDKTAITLTCVCVVVAFVLQYSEINYMLFGNLHHYLKYTPGRFCEMLPTACAGLLFVRYGLAEKLQARRKFVILMCAVIFVSAFILRMITGSDTPRGFGYAGIYLNVFAISVTIMFMMMPLKNLPASIKCVIGNISRFTPGVYCMHRLTALCLEFLTGREFDSFAGCIVIYITCLAVSFLLSLFFRKSGKYLVA